MIVAADITRAPAEATPSRVYGGKLERLYEGAAASFASPTMAGAGSGTAQDTVERTSAATLADPELIANLADAPELRAVEELRSWLHLSFDDVARVAGLSGASLVHHWRQRYRTGTPVRPRASTVEQLWRVHSLVRATAEALEGADQGYAVGLWARHREAGATPLELLLAGQLDEVERRAHRLLFDTSARSTPAWRVAGLEADDDLRSADGPDAPEYRSSDFA